MNEPETKVKVKAVIRSKNQCGTCGALYCSVHEHDRAFKVVTTLLVPGSTYRKGYTYGK